MNVQPATPDPSPEVVVVEEKVEDAPPDKAVTVIETVEEAPPEAVEKVQPEDVKEEVIKTTETVKEGQPEVVEEKVTETTETVEDDPPSPTPSPMSSPTQELRRASVLDESSVSRKTSIVIDKATTVEMDNVSYEVIPDPVTRTSTIIITPSRRVSTASDMAQPPPTRVPSVMFTTDPSGAITMESLDEDETIAETIEEDAAAPPPQIEQFQLPQMKDIDVKSITSIKSVKKKVGGLLCCR
jgi:hypothetical protein